MAGRACNVCSHPDRAEIDRALSHPNRVFARIAEKYGVSDDSVRAHHKNHLLPEMREKLALDLNLKEVDVLEEMRGLFQKMKARLEWADDTDNWQAIRAFHSEARQDLELLAKLLGELDERPQFNLHISPEWLELRAVILGALEPHPDAARAVLGAIEGVSNGNASG